MTHFNRMLGQIGLVQQSNSLVATTNVKEKATFIREQSN